MIDYQRLKLDLAALALLAACVFLALSLMSYDPADPPSASIFPLNDVATNLCGPVGARVAHFLQTWVGLGSWGLLAALVAFDLRLFARNPVRDPFIRIIGWLCVVLPGCLLLQMFVPTLGRGPVVGSGGYIGEWSRILLTERFSTVGTLIVAATFVAAGMILATESLLLKIATFLARAVSVVALLPFRLLGRIVATSRASAAAAREARALAAAERAAAERAGDEAAQPEPVDTADEAPEITEDPDEIEDDELVPAGEFKVNPPVQTLPTRRVQRLPMGVSVPDDHDFELPDLDLLEEAEDFPFELLAKKAQVAASILERTFTEFGLNVKVSEIDTGPVVTQFELELEPGLRVSKVAALQDDLAIALRVPAVRVVSPIPGKNTVGVEVPNDKQVMVRLRELIESCAPDIEKMRIPILLGKDVSGRPLAVDLTKMPHLLIAGRTGTGKSVCLNTLIVSMLMTRAPRDVRMLMIDPKMVELSPYMKIPHLMHPVITDMKKAEAVLAWAVDKMEERYDLLAKAGVRHLDSYNKMGKEKVLDRLGIDEDSPEAEDIPDHMPYIVIVADEMADMMMTSGKDVEGHIIRLAQKSRAVGIHLVLATQKPTVDIITGLIKSNLPARISFQVASRTDSRVVLDEMGAERLLGNGDMLYLAPGTSNLFRAQGTFISDDEVNSVIDYLSAFPPHYSAEIQQVTSGAANTSGIDAMRERDDLYTEAIDVVIREGRGSVSLLQRALGVGYGRAARMVDYMAEDGIVGPYNGSKHREVVMTREQWEAMQAGEEEPELEYA
ncbi:DNA translocase FtsK [Maioricimonas rarisocia]|uniref:DNA translocase FtsK n=1 Tax=Maioricimonas rarisocia TaxID=2528026 RepID=A0A517ZBL5_9PLAN|nr:DNA translocase FtsK [Maioricimonas rarisocia]QDU39883.1 DNA translocase FtsK [Maioricimonas rarisocia]